MAVSVGALGLETFVCDFDWEPSLVNLRLGSDVWYPSSGHLRLGVALGGFRSRTFAGRLSLGKLPWMTSVREQ